MHVRALLAVTDSAVTRALRFLARPFVRSTHYNGWANAREAITRQLLLSDSHAPGEYRANVPVANNDVFQRAFGVKPGDKMYLPPEQRVRIW